MESSREKLREGFLDIFNSLSDFFWDLFPSSPFYYIAYMLFVMAIGLFLIIYFSKQKPEEMQETKQEATLDDLLKIAKSSKSTTQDLLAALLLFDEKFKVEDDYRKSLQFFKLVLNHKKATSKKIFDIFHGKILPANIKFKNELDKIEREALNNKN